MFKAAVIKQYLFCIKETIAAKVHFERYIATLIFKIIQILNLLNITER